ncbi:photosystem II stability/assembly factor-like uncharacterized protein [Nocardiopsis mwathae]|uniref:Photosystem II stability/assembly factor-like uncharacterized protein n=1 Tax=Nocardiopsis mwathae TaxID=1472723 RepID=A0A7X0D4P0_9ACTN|nr:hypothetical protein [Nocardiopsis mwathae]MBB6171512.1 photosystem II stability/assembly factor-like uncharacterized protein [Nocardiopsis mwathae]
MYTTTQRLLGPAALLASALLVTACGPAAEDAAPDGADGTPVDGFLLPEETAHVHGIVSDPDSGGLLLGTHYGIYRVTGADDDVEAELIGPVMDYMGLAEAGRDRLVASGHPGTGTQDLPNPVGLLESTDGGKTWTTLSRAGQSDFHALTATEDTVIGFDGALVATDDGEKWRELAPDVAAISLATDDDATTVVATTQEGVRRSTDGGETFTTVDGAPPLMLVDWSADDTVLGIDPTGGVHRSDDAGRTWSELGSAQGAPEAFHATPDHIAAVVHGVLVVSHDEGATFGAPRLPAD